MSLSYRIPIIVSDIGSLGRLVKSKGIGFVAEPGNPDNFAEQLTKLGHLSSNDLIDMQHRLSQTGQEFSFESTAQTYLHAFKLAIAGSKTNVRRK
jgi:glycosyltransferase involved in cell wall biosynthesis